MSTLDLKPLTNKTCFINSLSGIVTTDTASKVEPS